MHTDIHVFYLSVFQVLDIFDMPYKNFGQGNISCELPETIWYNYYCFNPLMTFISILPFLFGFWHEVKAYDDYALHST